MIHRIRIQNFRSIRDVTVDLTPATVFVGKSGTGKSNFVNAIKFLRDFLNLGRQVVAPKSPFGDFAPAFRPKAQPQFTVEFRLPGYTEIHVYDLAFGEHGAVRPLRSESLKCGSETLFAQSAESGNASWDVEPALVAMPQPGEAALGRLPGLEKVAVAFAALTAGIGVYDFPNDVLEGKNHSPGGLNRPTQGVAGLADDAENYLEILKQLSSNLHDVTTRRCISAALSKINRSVVSVELDSFQQPTAAIVGHRMENKILSLDLRWESAGFRRFYAHLLALYQSPPKQTLIFEEPENGIYPGGLSLLADEFKAAAESGRGQVLLTTHSPRLLDHFEPEQIRVVELVDLETQIGPLAEEQREAIDEELLHAGELLTTDPARLEGAGT